MGGVRESATDSVQSAGEAPQRARGQASQAAQREAGRLVSPSPTRAGLTPEGVVALQRSAGNRKTRSFLVQGGRALARTAAEQEFAITHEGKVESVQEFVSGVPQLKDDDVDEFVLWNFLVDSTVVRRGHKATIDPVAQRWADELAADPNLGVRVIGYASVTGGVALNEDLARRRAESVRDHLVELGVSEDQIVIDSSGSRLPMDEGSSPQSLARNRRVEISKFVATTLAGSQADLDPGLNVQVTALKSQVSSNLKDRLDDDRIVFTLGPASVQATIQSSSFNPDIEVGAIQFVTSDVRRGAYSAADANGEVADFHAPPIAAIDYDHCLNAFAPCRDVALAKDPFSGDPGGAFTTVRPSPTPQDLLFLTSPHVAFPETVDVPGQGPAVFTAGQWQMTFTVLLVARKGSLVIPLGDHAEWDLDVGIRMIVGPDPKQLSRQLTTSVSVNSRTGVLATGAIPDIEQAMTRPTTDLRLAMMDRLCKPTILPLPGLGSTFDANLEQVQEELRRAAGQLLQGL
jgi:outer membrane protein OmpA-like peptidoglycan-associated protein